MTMLVLGLVLFLGVHATRIVADGWRSATIARIGARRYKAVYTLLSLVGFALLVWAMGRPVSSFPCGCRRPGRSTSPRC